MELNSPICFIVPDNMSVYGVNERKQSISEDLELTSEEIAINVWLDEFGVRMSDPMELVYSYFEKKKSKIAAEKVSVAKKQTSNLWERRKNTRTTLPPSLKSSQSSDDGSSTFFE